MSEFACKLADLPTSSCIATSGWPTLGCCCRPPAPRLRRRRPARARGCRWSSARGARGTSFARPDRPWRWRACPSGGSVSAGGSWGCAHVELSCHAPGTAVHVADCKGFETQSLALSVFLNFFNNKKCFLHFNNNLFLHQSYLKSPLPVKLT